MITRLLEILFRYWIEEIIDIKMVLKSLVWI